MAPQITPEMWGFMAGTSALEKSGRKKSKHRRGGPKPEKTMGAPKGKGGKRHFGSPGKKPPKGGSLAGYALALPSAEGVTCGSIW